MKPRNKYEKRVAEFNATLSEDIAVKDVEWYKRISKDWDFGYGHYCYFTIYTNIAEFEVKRLYRGYKYTDKSTDHFFFTEIMREFYDGDKKTYFAKKRIMGGYFDSFSFNSSIELKGVYMNYCGYQIDGLMKLSCASRSQSRGKRVNCECVNPKELARVICNNPVAETMYKEDNPMFYYLLYGTYTKQTCRAYTLAKRHGFEFNQETIPLWIDMVNAIVYCGKDWHNPVYIAPKDLRATHDRFIKMRFRKREQDEIIRKNRKAELQEKRDATLTKKYEKARKRFFDMELKSGSLVVSVLPDIKAFREMADYFHNCVFSNEYWNMDRHPSSLIMVACIGGHRAELIEVNLNTYKVAQCYGVCNQFTNYHKRIVNFLNKQMETIKAYNEGNIKQRKAA